MNREEKDQFSERFRQILPEIRRVLLQDWDPLDVAGSSNSDTYDSYIPQIFAHIEDGRSAPDLAEYLLFVETSQLGVNIESRDEALQRLEEVASELLNLGDETGGPGDLPDF